MLDVKPAQLDDFLSNIEASCARQYRQFRPKPAHKGTLILCGGGPSLADHEDDIRRWRRKPKTAVYALNSAVDWLAEHGIRADACVMMEIAKWPEAMGLKARPGVTYYLSSFAHPDTYARVGPRIVQWHADAPGMEIVARTVDDPLFIHCMSNAGPTTLVLGLWQGYRRFEAYGMDCSFDGVSHAYEHCDEDAYQARANAVELPTPWGMAEFTTTKVLHRQAREVVEFCRANRGRFRLHVHGEGLLACVHRLYCPEHYER